MVQHQATISATTQRAAWEVASDAKIQRKGCQRRILELQRLSENDVALRKGQLAELFAADCETWRSEMRLFGETQDDRKHRLGTRAMALGARREGERRANVAECLQRQQRLACDDVRTRDSHAVFLQIAAQRQDQILEKVERYEAQRRTDALEVSERDGRLREADAAERIKIASVRAHEHDVKYVLDEQVALLAKRSAESKLKRAAEDAASDLEWHAAVEAEAAKLAALRKEATARGRAVVGSNSSASGTRAFTLARDKAQDSLLLSYQLASEKSADAADVAKLENEKVMAALFKTYLDGFEKMRDSETAAVDEERWRIEQAIWTRKDAEQTAQHDARKFLAAEVDAGRQHQMADAQQIALEDARLRALEVDAVQRQQAMLDGADDAKTAMHARAHVDNQLRIREQMAHNASLCAHEAQAAFFESKMQAKTELDFESKVAAEGGRIKTNYPVKSTNWYG
ncbi:hypothetical protein M885DRAFT_501303 [Pelagophyceae sp. CCMP2097]|nr:hypothetical protein M885DRAFT_501303 [Pelagophyceae sp. CCMP2097]